MKYIVRVFFFGGGGEGEYRKTELEKLNLVLGWWSMMNKYVTHVFFGSDVRMVMKLDRGSNLMQFVAGVILNDLHWKQFHCLGR